MTNSWVQTLFPKQESSWISQKGIWNGTIAPSHFIHLVVWIWKSSMPWKICSTYKLKTSSLAKIGSNALQPRFWMQNIKNRCSWGCWRTHSSKCTPKNRFALSVTGKNKTFNGTLGIYPHKKVHIGIDPNAKPVHSRIYPVPWIHLKTFKTELNHLVRIGVLAPQQ
jgi:hypothetical protein